MLTLKRTSGIFAIMNHLFIIIRHCRIYSPEIASTRIVRSSFISKKMNEVKVISNIHTMHVVSDTRHKTGRWAIKTWSKSTNTFNFFLNANRYSRHPENEKIVLDVNSYVILKHLISKPYTVRTHMLIQALPLHDIEKHYLVTQHIS